MTIQSFVERHFPTCLAEALYPDDEEQDNDVGARYTPRVQAKIQFNLSNPTDKDSQTIYNCKVLAQFNPETQILCSAHVREDEDDDDYKIVFSSMNKTAAKVISFFYSMINYFRGWAGKEEISNPYLYTKDTNEYLLMDLESLYGEDSPLGADLTHLQHNAETAQGIDNALHTMLKQAREHLKIYEQKLKEFPINLSRLDTAIQTIRSSEQQFAQRCGIEERPSFEGGIPSFPIDDDASSFLVPPSALAWSKRLNERNTEFHRALMQP